MTVSASGTKMLNPCGSSWTMGAEEEGVAGPAGAGAPDQGIPGTEI